jgi:hypothetical protein
MFSTSSQNLNSKFNSHGGTKKPNEEVSMCLCIAIVHG